MALAMHDINQGGGSTTSRIGWWTGALSEFSQSHPLVKSVSFQYLLQKQILLYAYSLEILVAVSIIKAPCGFQTVLRICQRPLIHFFTH
jgi:hypothetical protein